MSQYTPTPFHQTRHLLVSLDLTSMDKLLMQYVQFLCNALPTLEQITFFHNIRFDFPEQANEILDSLDQPLEEVLQDKVQQQVAAYLPNCKQQIMITQEDDTVLALAEVQKERKADTILFGKKVSYDGSGYLIERAMYRGLNAHILVLPESAFHRFEHFLVPTDFSKNAAKALKETLSLASIFKAKVSSQHVYNIPGIYFPYIPVKDMRQEIEKDIQKKWGRFLSKHELSLEKESIKFSFQAEKSTPKTIYSYALSQHVDLIVMPAEPSVLRSTTVQLLKLDMHLPILLVRT